MIPIIKKKKTPEAIAEDISHPAASPDAKQERAKTQVKSLEASRKAQKDVIIEAPSQDEALFKSELTGKWRPGKENVAEEPLVELAKQNRARQAIEKGVMGKPLPGTKPGTAPVMPGTIPTGVPGTQGEMPELSQYRPETIPGETKTQKIARTVFPFAPQAIKENTAEFLDAVSQNQQISEGISSAAQLISSVSDFLPSFLKFSESKTTEVKKAEASFADANAVLDDDIKQVELGLQDWTKVNEDIDSAVRSINDLESQTKGMGKANLRYWIDMGAEIDEQIKREKSMLENKRIRLMQAAAKASSQSAMANYGL